jgi:hypothetical protein
MQRRQIFSALRLFNLAQESGFDPNECAAGRWNCWMLVGDFERAWEESDLISASGAPDPHRFWDGASWSGKRVMVRGLHGLGDTIQFIRYAPLLAETAESVVAQVHPQLVTLIEGVRGIGRVYTWGEAAQPACCEWDVQMEVTELPRAFKSTLARMPSSVPYIDVPPERQAWARELVGPSRALRVGLLWETGPWDSSRTIPLEAFNPLFSMRGAEFYSLQKGGSVTHLQRIGTLRDIEIHSADVRDTAALILQMDVIVTADTMTAHLAGALARPVWILLPVEADWRWMLNTRHSPWYPTARLFRQTRPGDWGPVMAEVAANLAAGTLPISPRK